MGKKKGGKKGKKSGKGKSSAKSIKSAISDPAKEQELDNSSKDFWNRQVDDLNKQVGDYQRTCDLMDVNNQEKVQRLEQLSEEKEDIHSYLANKLQEKTAELQDLTLKLVELQKMKDAERESYEAQLASLESEYQETKDALSREQENLSNKLGSMKEYEIQRAELMAKFAKIEEELTRQQQEHQQVIYDLERQMVVDKDRLRKEAAEKVTNLATEFRKVSDKQMEDTKKKALRENVTLNKNLQRFSDKTIALIEENDAYKYRAKQNQLLIEMLEFNEKELSRKFHKNVQQIKLMLDKAKGMEGLIQEYQGQTKDFDAAIDDHRQTILNMESLQNRYSTAQCTHVELKERRDDLIRDNKAEEKSCKKLENLLLETAHAIKLSLPAQEKDDTGKVDSPEGEDSLAAQREVLIHHLMRLLNSASNMGVGPQAAEFQVEKPQVYSTTKSHTSMGTRSSALLGARGSKPFVAYKGGVLGLIPLPDAKSISGSQFQRKDSNITMSRKSLGANKSVLVRSIATQTVSVPKAIFMARRRVQTDDNPGPMLKKPDKNYQTPIRL